MSEEVISTPITAESQIPSHIRENYENARVERGLTWEQMAEQFGKDRNGSLLQSWALERAGADSNVVSPAGIESRGEVSGVAEVADAPKKSKRGNAKGLDPVPAEVAE